jgi:hypothetical protein
MAGFAAALERFLTHDHEADFREHLAQAETVLEILSVCSNVDVELIADQRISPDPVVRISAGGQAPSMRVSLRPSLFLPYQSIARPVRSNQFT